MKFLNKKGSILQIFVVITFLFLIGIAFFVQHYIMNELSSEIRPKLASATPAHNKTIHTAMLKVEKTTNMFDAVFVIILMGMILAGIITSYLVDVHPVFMGIFWLLIGLAIVISVPISNSFEKISEQTVFASTLDEFPMTSKVFEYLPIWTLLFGTIITIVQYAKTRSTEGFGGFGGGMSAI